RADVLADGTRGEDQRDGRGDPRERRQRAHHRRRAEREHGHQHQEPDAHRAREALAEERGDERGVHATPPAGGTAAAVNNRSSRPSSGLASVTATPAASSAARSRVAPASSATAKRASGGDQPRNVAPAPVAIAANRSGGGTACSVESRTRSTRACEAPARVVSMASTFPCFTNTTRWQTRSTSESWCELMITVAPLADNPERISLNVTMPAGSTPEMGSSR